MEKTQYKKPDPKTSNYKLFDMVVGSRNYGLEDNNSDIDKKCFVLPNKNDIYLNRRACSVHISQDIDIEYKDIREFPELIFKSNPAYLELLYSKEVNILVKEEHHKILLQKYLNYFIDNREEIVKFNLPKLWSSTFGMQNKLFKEYNSTKNPKRVYHLYRTSLLLKNYVNNGFNNYSECLIPIGNERQKLLDIKGGKYSEKDLELAIFKAMNDMASIKSEYMLINNSEVKYYDDYINKTMELMSFDYNNFPLIEHPQICEDLKLRYSFEFTSK